MNLNDQIHLLRQFHNDAARAMERYLNLLDIFLQETSEDVDGAKIDCLTSRPLLLASYCLASDFMALIALQAQNHANRIAAGLPAFEDYSDGYVAEVTKFQEMTTEIAERMQELAKRTAGAAGEAWATTVQTRMLDMLELLPAMVKTRDRLNRQGVEERGDGTQCLPTPEEL